MPDSLPENVVEIVNKLKARAENSKEGKTKFFNPTVTALLFRYATALEYLIVVQDKCLILIFLFQFREKIEDAFFPKSEVRNIWAPSTIFTM